MRLTFLLIPLLMRNVSLGLLGLSTLLIAACTPTTPDDGATSSSSVASTMSSAAAEDSSSSLPRETANVSYTGVVQPSGISIYMEGTHRLVLEDGRFLLLTSEAVDLNNFVGQDVDVRGAIRPTVEGNGMIMRVESVEVNVSSSSETSSSSSDATSSMDSSISSSESSSSEMSSSSSSSSASLASSVRVLSSSLASSKALPSSVAVSSQTSSLAVSSSSQTSGTSDAHVEAMAKDDLAPEKWTQRYCSSHIGFCFDVHKNWWYKSFGTTTTALWDVEISNAELEVPGDGPIKVQLMSGELTGASDGQVKAVNGMAIGYRTWTEGRHFEISAPLALQGAVTVITNKIAAN